MSHASTSSSFNDAMSNAILTESLETTDEYVRDVTQRSKPKVDRVSECTVEPPMQVMRMVTAGRQGTQKSSVKKPRDGSQSCAG